MFEWFRSRPTLDKIYSGCLQVLNLGYALWCPEPDAPGEPEIGDVGYVDEGKLIRLLNFNTYAGKKMATRWSTPLNYIEHLPPNALVITRTPDFLSAGDYSSHKEYSRSTHASLGIASVGVNASYDLKGSHGAAFSLKSTADLEKAVSSTILNRYIMRNYKTWATYALEELGLNIEKKDIVVVSGCIKTAPDWTTTVFRCDRKEAASLSLEASAGPATGEMGGSHTFSERISSVHRQGAGSSPAPAGVEDTRKNHCVAIRRLKIRTRFPAKIVAGAGYHQLPSRGSGSGSGDSLNVGESPDESGDSKLDMAQEPGYTPDRLDILLDYMLEVSGARAVIASDDDIESILDGKHVLDIFIHLRQVDGYSVQVTDGVGYIHMEDLINSEQKRKMANRLIKKADVIRWPDITLQGAGCLDDCIILRKPLHGNARSFKYKAVNFGDTNTMQINNHNTVALSTDGTLLTAAVSTTIVIWRLQDGLTVQQLRRDGHTAEIWSVALSPDGQYVLSGAKDALALVWSVNTGEVVHRFEGHTTGIKCAEFSPNGALIATRSDDALRIWDALRGNQMHIVTNLEAPNTTEIRFSPDSSRLFANSDTSVWNTTVVVFDCHTGKRIATLRKQYLTCKAFSPEGDRIATGSRDRSVRLWDAATGKALLDLEDHTDEVKGVAFSFDGGEIATASDDGTIVTRDSRSGKRRFTFRVESVRGRDKEGASAVAYSARNDFLACGAVGGCISVWNRKTGDFVATFQAHDGEVRHLIFTPDGWDLLSYTSGGVVHKWSIRNARRLS